MDQSDTPNLETIEVVQEIDNPPQTIDEKTEHVSEDDMQETTNVLKSNYSIPCDERLASDETVVSIDIVDAESTDDVNVTKVSTENEKIEIDTESWKKTEDKTCDSTMKQDDSQNVVTESIDGDKSLDANLENSVDKSPLIDLDKNDEDTQPGEKELLVDTVDDNSSVYNVHTEVHLQNEEIVTCESKNESSSNELIEQVATDDNDQDKWIVTDSTEKNIGLMDSELKIDIEDVPIMSDSIQEDLVKVTVVSPTVKDEIMEEIVELRKDTVALTDSDVTDTLPHEKIDESNKCSIINYNQESSETIEIGSMEVVESTTTESCTEQDNKENAECQKSDDITVAVIEVLETENNEQVSHYKNIEKDISEDTVKKVEVTKESVVGENEELHVTDVHIETVSHVNEDQNQTEDKITCSTISCVPSDEQDEQNVSLSKSSTTKVSPKNRSVIQDIFDDWGVEEDVQSTPKIHDSVEIELKSLLDDNKTNPKSNENTERDIEKSVSSEDNKSTVSTTATKGSPLRSIRETVKRKELVVERQLAESIITSVQKNRSSSLLRSRESLKSTSQGTMPHSPAAESYVPVTRNRMSNLMVSSEVTEVLKERLREKQKMMEAHRAPDPFFVHKITQRLSSKLAGSPVSSIPALIPLPHPTQSSTDNNVHKSPGNANADSKGKDNFKDKDNTKDNSKEKESKDRNSDNKELLAILEGDVDPDWSDLKPPMLTEEGKSISNVDNIEHSVPPKLDPLVERELALKQLLELPPTPVKKSMPKKKKTFKPAASKMHKETDKKSLVPKEDKQEIVNIDLVNESAESVVRTDSVPKVDLTDASESDSIQNIKEQELRLDESRSGRKRKLTEKAREHEQNTAKRQKVYKSKVSITRQSISANENIEDVNIINKEDMEIDTVSRKQETDVNIVNTPKTLDKQIESKTDASSDKSDHSTPKQPKQSLSKKGTQPVAKKKMVEKKIVPEKVSPTKRSVDPKSKVNVLTKKSIPQKITTKSQKRSMESNTVDVKPKKKNINEIDRLLQDEGVVNLLYDVEQPDKKRFVPITKSQAKVMDIQKVQRELNIRKKLVRNAVLRLRTSTGGVAKVSPRPKRGGGQVRESSVDKKGSDQTKSPKTASAENQADFIIPAKIRNAADASIIIRRHSSSSFSSASGSPRVSIDAPEKQTIEASKTSDASHSLRSAKRRHSQDEKISTKKAKKKIVQKAETDIPIKENIEDKTSTAIRSNKKVDSKKVEKNVKQLESIAVDEKDTNLTSKVVTRSNGATTTGKVTAKSKKTAKSKVTFAKNIEGETNADLPREDKLSVCLAEAATALSVVNANRSGNSAVNRKNKVSTNAAKLSDSDADKTKTDVQCQFNNKEITVRRHGNLVQLILTPSTSTRIKNALTLQVMQEFRETLSILEKDDNCRVVLLTSTGTSFCEGLELSTLLHTDKEQRRICAEEMANGVKEFIKCLATFNKPIVAGVQGAAIGLGVTMLPLFDLVIASDKATFSTPYGKLGQIAEGAAIFTLSHILGSTITSELLLSGRTFTASEALRAGLVTRVLWPDRFQVELLPSLRVMSEQSSQSMEATKALLRHTLHKKLDAAIESETYLLIQHWCSAECQAAIKAYIDGKVQ